VKQIEHQHQKALIEWAHRVKIASSADVETGASVGHYLLAIPNGGQRSKATAARLKAEGVKAGVSDLLLPLRRGGFGGLFLEMKAPGNKPTPLQREWLARMKLAGYRAEWRDDWRKAAQLITDYLDGSPDMEDNDAPELVRR
jgi:hypothetical protein